MTDIQIAKIESVKEQIKIAHQRNALHKGTQVTASLQIVITNIVHDLDRELSLTDLMPENEKRLRYAILRHLYKDAQKEWAGLKPIIASEIQPSADNRAIAAIQAFDIFMRELTNP